MKEKRLAGAALYHIIIFAIGIIMVYPSIWMVMSSLLRDQHHFHNRQFPDPGTFCNG